MHIPELKFIDSGSASTFELLCSELNGVLQNDTILLNNNTWKGSIKRVEVEPGLYLNYWNCSLLLPLLLKHDPASFSVQPSYNLIYALTPGIFSFDQGNPPSDLFIRRNTDTFFTTNQTKANFQLTPNNNFKALFISITAEWVQQYFQGSEKHITELALPFQPNPSPLLVFETSNKKEYLLANEIADHLQNKEADHLLIHSRLLLLILHFFNKRFIHDRNEKNNKFRSYFDKLKKAESIINDHLSGKLPSLKEISNRVDINETALKRYFKLLYGKNIYEYYLQKKMDQAKRMLIEDNLNVNEVALNLGYENTTNFIEIFKKHFGYPPGTIRKNPIAEK